MESKELERFLNKKVRITLKTNFGLTGTVKAVNKNSIEFETPMGTSLIDIDSIATIMISTRKEEDRWY